MKTVTRIKYWGLSALVVVATLGGVAATTFAEAPAQAETAVVQTDSDPEPIEETEFVDWFTVAATALGLDETAVYDALDEGKSLADLATENGIDPQTVADAIIAAETEWINGLVAAGDITAEEAAEWLAELPEYVTEFVNSSYDDLGEEYGVNWEAIVAEQLGITEDELWQAYAEGKSIADLAAEAGIDTQAIINALVAAETEFINSLVADGTITQDEANEWIAELPEYIKSYVEDSWDNIDFGEEVDWVDWDEIAATALGISVDDLYAAYAEGKSIAALAGEKNVDPATVASAIVAAETEFINGLVADGVISQEEADEWLGYLTEDVDAFVNNTWDETLLDDEAAFPDWDEAAATAIGLTLEQLYAAYDEGQSLAEIIAAQGVDSANVVEVLTAVEAEFIDSLVADGTLTQDEADEWLNELPEIVTEFVETDWDDGYFDDAYVDFDDDFVDEGFDEDLLDDEFFDETGDDAYEGFDEPAFEPGG